MPAKNMIREKVLVETGRKRDICLVRSFPGFGVIITKELASRNFGEIAHSIENARKPLNRFKTLSLATGTAFSARSSIMPTMLLSASQRNTHFYSFRALKRGGCAAEYTRRKLSVGPIKQIRDDAMAETPREIARKN